LKDHDCIVYHRWGEDNVWWFSSPEGELSVPVHGRFRANNAVAVRRAALDGLGVAQLSHLMVEDDLRAGRLQALLPDFPPLRVPLSVVYPSRRNLPPRTRAVIEFLAELFRADPATRDTESDPASCVKMKARPRRDQ
jgi:DNA-binding transcriptional LysR family regulator